MNDKTKLRDIGAEVGMPAIEQHAPETEIIERTNHLRFKHIEHRVTMDGREQVIPEMILEQAFVSRSSGKVQWIPVPVVKG